ncbi:MAG: glycosyltransferase family 9 protein [Chitinophagales bacterium]
MKILILRFSSIGDIVLTSPVLRCVKEQVPDVRIHYATKKSYAGIVASNPYVDKVHALDKDIKELIVELSRENFDLIIDLHNNVRTQIIKFRLRIKSKTVNKLNFEKWLLTQFKIDKLPKYNHIVDRYLYTAKTLGVKNDGKGLDFFIPKKDEIKVSEMFPEVGDNYIAIAIGAKFFTKRLPYTKIIEICNKLNQPIILLGGLEDLARGEEIVRHTTNQQVVTACGKLNLNQSAWVVKQAQLLITHDTGLMHIGAAFNKNMITIWGNTVPELGMYPYMDKENYKIIQVEDLSCKPCSKIGYKECPKKHFKCMNDINTDEIVKQANYYLIPA